MQVTILDPADFIPNNGIPHEPVAELIAMLQAFTSRSAYPLENRLQATQQEGRLEAFMQTYYVGYGHRSIGQCAPIAISLVDVSMIAAKIIQSDPFYNGQEMSTRFIDFREAKLYNAPYWNNDLALRVQNQYRSIADLVYTSAIEHFYATSIKPEEVTQAQFENTIKSRACDIARGFLPCGTLTNLTWSTTIDNLRQMLKTLLHHPLYEIRCIGRELLLKAIAKYANSFDNFLDRIEDSTEFLDSREHNFFYFDVNEFRRDMQRNNVGVTNLQVKIFNCPEQLKLLQKVILKEKDSLGQKPKYERLSRITEPYGNLNISFNLDFGCFRDLQRHRVGYIPFPVIESFPKLEEWYLTNTASFSNYEVIKDKLAEADRLRFLCHGTVSDEADKLMLYIAPMAISFPCLMSVPYAQLIHILETRSSPSVHPILRNKIQTVASYLDTLGLLPYKYNIDDAPQQPFNWPRGNQTINERK